MKRILLPAIIMILSAVLFACGADSSASTDQYYSDLDESAKAFYQENEVLYSGIDDIDDERYLLYVHSPECKFCIQYMPEVQTYEARSEGTYPLYKINASLNENANVWETYGIEGVPTTLLMENGEEIDRIVGYVPAGDIFTP